MEGGKGTYAAVAIVDVSKNLCELHGFLVGSKEERREKRNVLGTTKIQHIDKGIEVPISNRLRCVHFGHSVRHVFQIKNAVCQAYVTPRKTECTDRKLSKAELCRKQEFLFVTVSSKLLKMIQRDRCRIIEF